MSRNETYSFSWQCGSPGRWTSWAVSKLQQPQTAGKELSPVQRKNKDTSCTHTHTHPPQPQSLPVFDCTWRERGTVGHSWRHRRLIPATPKEMNNMPKNRKIWEGEKKTTKHYNRTMWWRVLRRMKDLNTLCSQCRLSDSPSPTWHSAKSCEVTNRAFLHYEQQDMKWGDDRTINVLTWVYEILCIGMYMRVPYTI